MPPPPLSILFVTDWFPPGSVGGVEAAAYALALALMQSGAARVAVLTPALPGGPTGVRAIRAGASAVVRIYYAPRGAGVVARLGAAAAWAPPSLLGGLALLRSIAARERTSTLHAHSSASPFALAALAAARALGLACILTDHSMGGQGGGGWARLAWDAAAAGCAPAVVTAVSSAAAADTAARLGRPHVTVLRNAIDGGSLAAAAATQATAAPATTTIRALSVSRLTARKGAAGLGSAIAAAAATDENLAFTVVGGGPGRADLLAGLRGSGAPLTLTGPLPPSSIPPLLASHHVFLSASTTEAFGLAALEAAAVGLTVVAFDVGGLREALGGRGRLVPLSEGPAGLAAAVVDAAADLRARHGVSLEAASASVPSRPPPLASILANHCWHAAAAAVIELYRQAAAAPPFPPLPGRPLTAVARALVHAFLLAFAALLAFLDPAPGERTGLVFVDFNQCK